jgi:hypothetical protein
VSEMTGQEFFPKNIGLIGTKQQSPSWVPVAHACNPSYLGG